MKSNVCFEFILRKSKALSLVYYITDYQTKLAHKTYHRVAVAASLRAKRPPQCSIDVFAESKRFIIQTFNKLSTTREVSAVEIAQVTLGLPEFYTNNTYRTISFVALHAAMQHEFPDMTYRTSEDISTDDRLIIIDPIGKVISYFIDYQNRPKDLLTFCLYDFTSLVKVSKSNKYILSLDYSIPSFSGPAAHHHYTTPEGRSRFSAIILGLFLPWHMIPIIALGVSGPKTFVNILTYWLNTCCIPDRIRHLISNFELLRKSAAEVEEDRKLRVLAANGKLNDSSFTDLSDTLDNVEEDFNIGFVNKENILVASTTTATDNVILALEIITSTNRQPGTTDLIPLSNGDYIISNMINDFQSIENDTCKPYGLDRVLPEPLVLPESHLLIDVARFDKTSFISWKSSLKSQEENNLFLACGGTSNTDNWDIGDDIGDNIESIVSQSASTIVGVTAIDNIVLPTWADATRITCKMFSLNIKQQRLVYLVVCGLCGALPKDSSSLLIYCGGEGGTGKSRIISAIRYLFNLMKIQGKLLP